MLLPISIKWLIVLSLFILPPPHTHIVIFLWLIFISEEGGVGAKPLLKKGVGAESPSQEITNSYTG